MARQISVSDEVYSILVKNKKNRSFSEVIKEMAEVNGGKKGDISSLKRFFGTIDKRSARAWIREIEKSRAMAGRSRVL